jgi:hypothetical protein
LITKVTEVLSCLERLPTLLTRFRHNNQVSRKVIPTSLSKRCRVNPPLSA